MAARLISRLSADDGSHERRRLIPYGLLGPGAIWLVLFFVVPMYFMGELALRSGTFTEGFAFTWECVELPRRARRARRADRPHVLLLGRRDRCSRC